MATAPTDLVFIYTNHRGETAERRVLPEAIRFASTQWHREPQWLLVAYDLDRGERRDFAWKDIRFPAASASIEAPVPSDDANDFRSAAVREKIARAACEAGHHAWPSTDGYNDRAEKRAWLKVADAALAVLTKPLDEETATKAILAMARAHDREDAAQKGEPSPWDHGAAEDALFVSERMAAMREAFDAGYAALAAVPSETAEMEGDK